jgi:CheY-like chemotaxis protein
MVSKLEPADSSASGAPGSMPIQDSHSARFVSEIMDAIFCNRPPALPSDVLIVEDDPIIALDFEDRILGLGVTQVRTAGNVAKALDMIAVRTPDFALLDVSLIREKSFAVAERLEALRIPFAFVTGYGADVRLPAAFAHKPRLPKPCPTDALEALLLRYRSGEGAAS